MEMKYTSTRGGVSGLSFEEALFSGYAPDGGLFFPETIPQIDAQTLRGWREAKIEGKLTYPQVVTKVVRSFVTTDEIPDETLELLVQRAYEKFQHSQVINFHSLTKNKENNNDDHQHPRDDSSSDPPASNPTTAQPVKVAELFHGRTKSFKDLALSLVGQFMHYFVNKRKSHITILIGTSGDTGSAAIDSVRGLTGVDVIVLYPKGKVSPVQELQMVSAVESNVHIFEVEGTSDDLDIPIKQCFPQAGLTSINSINWARIMIQIAHYVYIHVLEGTEVDIIVPTGAAGNLVSGLFAQQMGVPIRLFCATNNNDGVDLMLREGVLGLGGLVSETPASAMDIRNPYNVERILYLFSNNPETVKDIMEKAEFEKVEIPQDIMNKIRKVVQASMSVDTELIYRTVKNCWADYNYMVCPHTATALALYNESLSSRQSKNPVYILSTASPFKFPESALDAGIIPELWDGNKLLNQLEEGPKREVKRMEQGQNWLQILQDEINSIKFSRL